MPSNPSRLLRRLRPVAAAVAVGLVVAACGNAVGQGSLLPPDAATTQGQATRDLYNIVFVIGAAIFLLVEGLILFAVLRYRRRGGDDELPPQIHGNNRLEIVWTAVPIAIVLALFGLSWQTLNTVDATQPNPSVRIGVVAFQWQWQFVYAPPGINWPDCTLPQNKGKCVTIQGIPPANGDRKDWVPPTMVVPANETVELQMHSLDVIHSFYVPAFLFQRDITPGHDQVIQFTADKLGTYRGQCTQFCGLLHQLMEFQVQVVSPADYSTWLQGKLTPPSPSPAPSAAGSAGASPSAAPGSASPAGASLSPAASSAASPAASAAPSPASSGGASPSASPSQ